jgi:predicted metal-dependent peptidase
MLVNVKELRKVEVEYEPLDPKDAEDQEGDDGSETPIPQGKKPWNEKQDPNGENGPGGKGKGLASLKPKMVTKKPTDEEGLRKFWKQKLEEAKDRSAGSVPGNLLRAIERLLGVKIDWKGQLRKFVISMSSKSQYFLPNRRFLGSGNVLWGAKKKKENFETLVVISDTSGSVADAELHQFVTEALGVMESFNPKETYLIWCDTTVYEPIDIVKKGEKFSVKHAPGRGGTSFIPPFEWIEKNLLGKKKLGPILFFTDGYPNTGVNGGWPTEDMFKIKSYSNKVFWIIIGKGSPNEDPSIKIPFGKRIDLVM